jgi:hypothetical protein
MNDFLARCTDSTFDIVLLVVLGLSLLITIKIWLERQAIRRGGHFPVVGYQGALWPTLVIVSSVTLVLVNR